MIARPAEPRSEHAVWRTRRQVDRLDAAPRRDDESFSFALIGDAEPGRFIWERLLFGRRGAFFSQLRRIARENADFILQLGDMVSRGLHSQYSGFLRQLDLNCPPDRPYLTVMGNHDRHWPHGRSDSIVYRSYFGRPNYYFDRGGARFVVVDSSLGRLTRSQLKWLELVLSTDKRKLVFTHMPPAGLWKWTIGGLGGFTRGSFDFMDLMAAKGVDRVYMGHVHGLGRKSVDGVTYVLTGGGGSPLYPTLAPRRCFHFLLVEVGPEGVKETVQQLDGGRFSLDELDETPSPPWVLRLQLKFLTASALVGLLASAPR